MTDDELIQFLRHLYGSDDWPKAFRPLLINEIAKSGASDRNIARQVGTTNAKVVQARTSSSISTAVMGIVPADVPERIESVRKNLAGLLRGRAAEIAFEDIYKSSMHSSEFELVDVREGRSDTDYRLLNGGGRRLYRINIKFFGSNFRQGPELVGLQPEDCFPLATYKIHGALQKQEQEHLPYLFIIVGVPGLTAEALAPAIEDKYVLPLAWLSASKLAGKRDLEDKVVDRIVDDNSRAYQQAYGRIRAADWFVLSARRADKLVHDLLYERVFALRVRNFTKAYSRAEVDMHLSLSADMTSLGEFLSILQNEGPHKTIGMLERGSI
jgi:hypothetical protein